KAVGAGVIRKTTPGDPASEIKTHQKRSKPIGGSSKSSSVPFAYCAGLLGHDPDVSHRACLAGEVSVVSPLSSTDGSYPGIQACSSRASLGGFAFLAHRFDSSGRLLHKFAACSCKDNVAPQQALMAGSERISRVT